VQPFGFTGYQRDVVTNTYFAQARKYLPKVGRFGGEDWIKGSIARPFTLNPYGYCWGNPLKWIDLDGREPQKSSSEDWLYWVFGDSPFINDKGNNSKNNLKDRDNVKGYEPRSDKFREIRGFIRGSLIDSAQAINNGIQAIDDIIDANLEAGVGLGGEIDLGFASGEVIAKALFVEMDEHGDLAIKSEAGIKVIILGDMEAGVLAGYNYTAGQGYRAVGLNRGEFDGDLKYTFGSEVYSGIGGGGKATINTKELASYIKKIFECDTQN